MLEYFFTRTVTWVLIILKDQDVQDCVNAVRVFGGIGVVSGLVVTCLLLIFVNKTDNRRCLALSSATLCLVSAMLNQICTAVFSRTVGCFYTVNLPFMSEIKWPWSLALAFTSIILTVAAGLDFLILELREISRQRNSRRPLNGQGFVIT